MPLDSPHMHGLTPKQARFVMAYVETGNATGSARTAGYSEKSAEAIGLENLGKPRIAAAIDAETRRVCEKLSISQEWVLSRLALEASGFSGVDAGERLDTSSSSRVSALGTLSKCLGMQLDRNHDTGEIVLTIRRVLD